jgi:ankyrin repeat protein
MDVRAPVPPFDIRRYEGEANDLLRAYTSGDPAAIGRAGILARSGDPAVPSASAARFELTDAQSVVAREHGFASWSDFTKLLESLAKPSSDIARFEAAVDAIVAGDEQRVLELVGASSALVRARSTRQHRATLLHYVSANGVEDYRQRTPANIVAIAKALLANGAQADATSEIADSTTLNLTASSVHPAKAGVQVPLVEVLLDAGAAIDGIENDCAPLMLALSFGYGDLAQLLAARGAKVDTIVAAAGLGRLEMVKEFFDEAGTGKSSKNPGRRARVPASPEEQRAQALLLAAIHGRTDVAALLLEKGIDPGVKGSQGFTPLHWAAWRGHVATLKVLLKHGAPLEAKNDYGGTVLDLLVWGARHAPFDGVDYSAVAEVLVDAGADVNVVKPFPSGVGSIDELLRSHGAKP